MSSISKFRSSATTNRNQGGGNKLSGLPPSVGGNMFAREAWTRRGTVPLDKRNIVFCINQLGGVGKKSSMFGPTGDGVRCVSSMGDDNTVAGNGIGNGTGNGTGNDGDIFDGLWYGAADNGWGLKVYDSNDISFLEMQSAVNNNSYASLGRDVAALNGQFSYYRYAFLFKPGTNLSNMVTPFNLTWNPPYDDNSYNQPPPCTTASYYTSIIGLGESPDDVYMGGDNIACWNGQALAEIVNGSNNVGALDNFWRSVENIKQDGLRWAVSQATSLRRIHITGGVGFYEGLGGEGQDGYASGGFLANCKLGGTTNDTLLTFGSQQQWCSRNSTMSLNSHTSNWNYVFINCDSPDNIDPSWNITPYSCNSSGANNTTTVNTSDDAIPSSNHTSRPFCEKPYIIHNGTNYILIVPPIETSERIGPSWGDGVSASYTEISYNLVQSNIAKPIIGTSGTSGTIKADDITSGDNLSELNVNLSMSNSMNDNNPQILIITPGIYVLDSTIEVTNDNTIILGLGYPTIIPPSDGSPCIRVHKGVTGVRIAGLLLESPGDVMMSSTGGWNETDIMLHVGYNSGDNSNTITSAVDGCVLSDIFVRTGDFYESSDGGKNVSVGTMMQLDDNYTIIDNTWLWRADHIPNGTVINANGACDHGLVVKGDYVTAYGLAVEHTLKDLVKWQGDNGVVYFYQSELPYDISRTDTSNYVYTDDGKAIWGDPNDSASYSGYVVGGRDGDEIQTHSVYGAGVYCYWRDDDIHAEQAIKIAQNSTNQILFNCNTSTVYLNGGGAIDTVIKTQKGTQYGDRVGADSSFSGGRISNKNSNKVSQGSTSMWWAGTGDPGAGCSQNQQNVMQTEWNNNCCHPGVNI